MLDSLNEMLAASSNTASLVVTNRPGNDARSPKECRDSDRGHRFDAVGIATAFEVN